MIRAILAPRLFDGFAFRTGTAVLVRDGVVLDLVPPGGVPDGAAVERLPDGHTLCPGYVDLQVNGGGDVLLNDDPSAPAMAAIAAAHRALGTTALLPTLISGGTAQIEAVLSAAARGAVPGVIGPHVEGPFLAPARRGIHPADAIRPPADADLAALCGHAGPVLVTLAPEMVPAGTIDRLAASGAAVFAGHTAADAATMQRALDAGLRGVTHLFNAMPAAAARAPGPAGVALDDPRCMAGIILDLLHVDAAMARLAWRCMGPDRLFLVSDAMSTVGGRSDRFRLGDTEVRLADGRLAGPDGTLGGAHLCMAEAVRNAVAIGIPAADALRMATATPAKALGAPCGRIGKGAAAELIVLDAGWRFAGQAPGAGQHRPA